MLTLAAAKTLFLHGGPYAINAVLSRGGAYWPTISPTNPALPLGIRLGLQQTPPPATAGPFTWQTIQPGLDIAELPVIAARVKADSILLTRIDPAKFHFALLNAPAGTKTLKTWLSTLHPAALINASYYSPHGLPDTPFLSNNKLLSTRNTPPAQGAFIATANTATVEPLPNGNWRAAFATAQNALATYPLLITPAGPNKALQETHWLANRSFIGEDTSSRIIFGTTTSAFFSLRRLAIFLGYAPLDLKVALNMDGGPVACQAVSAPHFSRSFCGAWELQTIHGKTRHLVWPFGSYGLPVVLAAFPN